VLVVEDDVRHHAVCPPAAKKRSHLVLPTLGVDPGQTDRDKRRIPVPLEGIDARTRLDEEARVVPLEDFDRAGGES
jgi:hypothetical protein